MLYFFKFFPGQMSSMEKKCKGSYKLILKWRAKEFKTSDILWVAAAEGSTDSAASMAISTTDGQIMALNLHSEVYFPGHVKLAEEVKDEDGGEEEV